MPNIKSSVLSVKKDAKRRAHNIAVKTGVRKATRKVLDAVKAGSASEAQDLLKVAVKTIDKAAAKRVIHPNNAARKKSKLASKVNAAAAQA